MPIRTIFFDESGFTGYNLLDPQQPVFSIASADISEDRAEEILRASFPRYQGAEFHFTNIWRSGHKQGLKQFCNHLHEVADRSFCYATNKKFAVLAKIMEFLVEPAVTDAGFDFYDDGFCWKYTNFAYYGLTQFGPPELLDRLLNFYQEFSREPNQASLELLQFRLRMMAESTDDPIQMFLDQMATGAEIFERYSDLSTFKSSNSLQTSTMIAVIGHWRQRYQDDFAVIHDASSSFLRDRQTWEAVTGVGGDGRALKAGDGSFVDFPIRVVSTEAKDSRESRSIQFCDILAGLVSRHFNPNLSDEDRAFMGELVDEGLGNISSNRLVPGTEFPDQIPPKRLEGPDVVDQMAEMLRERLE